jgi:hypothetical protein
MLSILEIVCAIADAMLFNLFSNILSLRVLALQPHHSGIGKCDALVYQILLVRQVEMAVSRRQLEVQLSQGTSKS